MGYLGGGVDVETAVAPVPVGQHRPRLDGGGDQALVDHLLGDDDNVVALLRLGDLLLGLGDPLLVTPRPPLPGDEDVGLEVVVHLDRVGLGLLEVDDRGQGGVVHEDGVGGVLSERARLGHHHRHRFAGVVHHPVGEERTQFPDRHLRQ